MPIYEPNRRTETETGMKAEEDWAADPVGGRQSLVTHVPADLGTTGLCLSAGSLVNPSNRR
jgi:hypothetical protein